MLSTYKKVKYNRLLLYADEDKSYINFFYNAYLNN